MYGYIYKTTNLVNGKIYIGKKKGKFIDTYFGSGRYLRNALEKYGVNSFKVEKIEDCETLEIQNVREKYWIEFYMKSNVSMYNISKGGDGGDTFYKLSDVDRIERVSKLSKNSYFANLTKEQSIQLHTKAWETRRINGNDKMSEEQKIKLSKSHKGQKVSEETIKKIVASRKGYRHSDEIKRKISESNKCKIISQGTRLKMSQAGKKRCGELNGFYGKTHSEEIKALIGSYNKDRFVNRIWINDGTVNKRVPMEDLPYYKELGFIEGRIKWANKR